MNISTRLKWIAGLLNPMRGYTLQETIFLHNVSFFFDSLLFLVSIYTKNAQIISTHLFKKDEEPSKLLNYGALFLLPVAINDIGDDAVDYLVEVGLSY